MVVASILYDSLQFSQILRTRRWAPMRIMLEVIRKGSTPILTNRITEPLAVVVCNVLKTRWPVRAAFMAISTVSKSLISPTIIISGYRPYICK